MFMQMKLKLEGYKMITYELYPHTYCIELLTKNRCDNCDGCIEDAGNQKCDYYEPVTETLVREVEE